MDASGSPAAPRRGTLRVLAPYGLLLALLAATPFFVRPAGPDPALSLDSRGLERARTAFAVRGVRHALAAHRFRTGQWPESLDELVAEGNLGSGTLAEAGGRPYYYHDREGQGFVLAPEP